MKVSCQLLAQLLHHHGVRKIVLCPGSRNAPIVAAIERSGLYQTTVVIDERSAAFIALGMALRSSEPVAVVCTSGTALLNFTPAVAEAYYRQVPLIAISADRPAPWIDQDDSQTLRQFGALQNIVRHQVNIAECHNEQDRWYASRMINDACIAATASSPQGPVHINLQIDEPLFDKEDYLEDKEGVRDESAKGKDTNKDQNKELQVIKMAPIESHLCESFLKEVALRSIVGKKVMIVAGFMHPHPALLNQELFPKNVVLLSEAQSNLGRLGNTNITRIDATLRNLRSLSPDGSYPEEFVPDTIITIGGAILSRHLKAFLRRCPQSLEHFHVGQSVNSIDCFKHLNLRIPLYPEVVLKQMAPYLAKADSQFANRWLKASKNALEIDNGWYNTLDWSDFTAIRAIVGCCDQSTNLHLSNGTAIRYVQLFEYTHIHSIDCNRGVSGIDGCTSTAIGDALCREKGKLTVLITGDMSAQYDIGALSTENIPSTFRMAVINNGGGGIFRFVSSTRDLKERERNFCCQINLPLKELAKGYGFEYLQANDMTQLQQALPQFFSKESQRPILLSVNTDPVRSAELLNQYFSK